MSPDEPVSPNPHRRHLPPTRNSITHKGSGCGHEFYVTVSFWDEDDTTPPATPGEVFVKISKHGSDLAHFVEGWAIMVSLSLQHGVTWGKIRSKFLPSPQENILSAIVKTVDLILACRRDATASDPSPKKDV